MVNTLLWWLIGTVIALILMAALGAEMYGRSARRRERRLSHRRKRRIEL
jgi:cytochrome c-type biogenesis protein CcmH/NrfF